MGQEEYNKIEALVEMQADAMQTLQDATIGWCKHINTLEDHIKAQEEVIKMAMDCFEIEKKVDGGISRTSQIGLAPFVHEFLEQANKNLHKKDDVLKVFRKTMPHFLKDK